MTGDRFLMQSLMGETPKTALHRQMWFNNIKDFYNGAFELTNNSHHSHYKNNNIPAIAESTLNFNIIRAVD